MYIVLILILLIYSNELRYRIEYYSAIVDGYLIGIGAEPINLEYPVWGIIPIPRLYFNKNEWELLEYARELELQTIENKYLNKTVKENELNLN
jgi:hypothetical protein